MQEGESEQERELEEVTEERGESESGAKLAEAGQLVVGEEGLAWQRWRGKRRRRGRET